MKQECDLEKTLHQALELIDSLIAALDENDVESDWAAEIYAALEWDYLARAHTKERPAWLDNLNQI